MPQTRSRCFSARAIEAMRIDEVFDARIASGATTASSSPNSFCFTSRFSNTASTTTWQPLRSDRLSAMPRLASVLATSASVNRPLVTRPFKVSRIAAFALAAPPAAASNMIALMPPCAVTCAMPRPMAPVPTTPTVRSGRFTSRAILISFCLLLRRLPPLRPEWSLGLGHPPAGVGGIEPIQYSERALRLATYRHQPEPHLGIMGGQRRRRHFLDQLVDADATRARQIAEASVHGIRHTDGQGGHGCPLAIDHAGHKQPGVSSLLP